MFAIKDIYHPSEHLKMPLSNTLSPWKNALQHELRFSRRNCYDQTCALPPSTNSSIPVTKLESSDARNNAALAISSGCPMRPIGTVDTIQAIASAGCRATCGVSTGPGLRTFERIRRSLSSEVQ